ncbi:MAG: hypothetical protein GY679_00815 [Mycoplasma sp.]|nr:hypothetical protein [Mycoplasma sp.]
MKRKNLISRMAICLYLVLALVLCVGCSNNVSKETIAKDYEIVEIDNCEYIIMDRANGGYQGYGFMAHKGNCKYCAKRALGN